MIMTCVAFTSVANPTRVRLSNYSTPSNSLACSWDNFDDNFEDEGLVPVRELEIDESVDLYPESRAPTNFSRSSSVKSNLVYGLFNCAKCKICSCSLVCWVQKRYKNFRGKAIQAHPVVQLEKSVIGEDYYITNEAIIRQKLEREDAKRDSGCHGDSSLSYSFNPHEDWSAADNLSWDASADFLDSFKQSVPYRTLKYTSTPRRLDHQDWIDIDEVDDLLPSAHSSPKLLHTASKPNRVFTTSTSTPTKQVPVQVTLKPPTHATSGRRRASREEKSSLRRVAIGHSRIERLKEDVAEVRSQIGLALKLCEQVESELNDMKNEDQYGGRVQLVRPSQMQKLYRRKQDDCYVLGPPNGVLRNNYHSSEFWTRQTLEPTAWLNKSAQHRVFVEEMKYHFKWQRFTN